MSYRVSGVAVTPMRLNEDNRVRSVLQSVSNIINTQRGTCPMYRRFGIDMRFADKPINVARTMVVADVRESVEEFEPRVKVISVTGEIDPYDPMHLIVTVEVDILES